MNNLQSVKLSTIINNLGDDTIINVNPKYINDMHGSINNYKSRYFFDLSKIPLISKIKTSYRGFFLNDSEIKKIHKASNDPKLRKIKNYIEYADNPKRSQWYRELNEQLLKNGTAYYKKQSFSSQSEIDEFFSSYINPLGLTSQPSMGGCASSEISASSPDNVSKLQNRIISIV